MRARTPVLLCLVVACNACAAGVGSGRSVSTLTDQPHIHTIGTSSVLVFERGRVLRIPVTGQGFWGGQSAAPDVGEGEDAAEGGEGGDGEGGNGEGGNGEGGEGATLEASEYEAPEIVTHITGTVPATEDYDFVVPNDWRLNSFNIDLLESYTQRLQTGDALTVQLTVSSGDAPFVASRSFTLVSLEDYRSLYSRNRLNPADINAFPLPEEEAMYLFGQKVSEQYFIVRLSVRNSTNEDRLISTGMIRASGTAVIEPYVAEAQFLSSEEAWETITKSRFSVPITLTPQSSAQVYTILDDEAPNEERSIFFRVVEFTGALATGLVNTFDSNTTWLQGTGLFTGVVAPELKNLWPDRQPDYERNVVSLGMPDLLKVPKGSIAGHKYLFFPKSGIRAVVVDPTYLGRKPKKPSLIRRTLDTIPLVELTRQGVGDIYAPEAHIVYLEFDNLDIPFENVFSPSSFTLRERLNSLGRRAASHLEKLRSLETSWTARQAGRFGDLEFPRWSALSALDVGPTSDEGLSAVQRFERDVRRDLKTLLEALEPVNGLHAQLLFDEGSRHGVERLAEMRDEVDDLARVYLTGEGLEQHAGRLDDLETTLRTSEEIYLYFRRAARLLARKDTGVALEAPVAQGEEDRAHEAFIQLRDELEALDRARTGLPDLPALLVPAIPEPEREPTDERPPEGTAPDVPDTEAGSGEGGGLSSSRPRAPVEVITGT